MSEIDSKNIIEYLEQKWKTSPCPMCGAKQWAVTPKSYELREFYGGNLVIGKGTIFPVIPVVCGNCGNTIFINPVVARLEFTSGKEGKKDE
jgi:hypothetical protein